MALRQSASKHSSRAQLTEKIKQQVHLNAVKNYEAPKNVDFRILMEKSDVPIKSILKKHNKENGGGTGTKKAGRVNYAFDGPEVHASNQQIRAEIHA